jgi:hypothetical protein
MTDYSALWAKGNDLFYTWEDEQIQAGLHSDLTDRDRMMFVTGFIHGYLETQKESV